MPFPSPSSAPEEVTDTADTRNPALIMRSAVPSGLYGGLTGSKEPYELSGDCQADNCAGDHNDTAHCQSNKINLPDSSVFSRAVIIADHRSHSLNDPLAGKIQKGLQLIVDSQDDYIALRECGQKAVQHRDEKGGQGQVKNCGNSDGIQTQIDPLSGFRYFPVIRTLRGWAL